MNYKKYYKYCLYPKKKNDKLYQSVFFLQDLTFFSYYYAIFMACFLIYPHMSYLNSFSFNFYFLVFSFFFITKLFHGFKYVFFPVNRCFF